MRGCSILRNAACWAVVPTALTVLFVVMVWMMPQSAVGQEMSATDLASTLGAATEAVRTVEGEFRTYFAKFNLPGAVMGPDGLGMYSEFRWGWDRDSRKEYLNGRWGFEHKGRIQYQPASFAFDGKKLRSINSQTKVGKISEAGETLLTWRTPLILAGLEVAYMPTRDLNELLVDAKDVTQSDTPSGSKLLRAEFSEGQEPMELTVTVDLEHGFLPRRIEIRRKITGMLHRLVETESFEEVRKGVWMPLKGFITNYAALVTPPEGITSTEFRKLDREKQLALKPQFKFAVKELGLGTQHFVIDPRSLHINEPIDDRKFSPEFPIGSLIWDDFAQRSYRYPQVKAIAPEVAPASRSGLWLVALNLAVLAIAASAWILRRRWKPKLLA